MRNFKKQPTRELKRKSAERILSIQSHVAYGYVGGKAATFPLQCLGYDVDIVNTVNFSNHAGYGRSGGTKSTATQLEAMFDAMENNELLAPQRILTGYTPDAAALSAISNRIQNLKDKNKDIIYLLDPVIGDSGRLYVSEDVIPIYRSMLQFADIITPNWFEVEKLADIPLQDMSSLRRAIRALHEIYGTKRVVISSIPLHPWLREALPEQLVPPETDEDEYLLCITSEKGAGDSLPAAIHGQLIVQFQGYYSGVGDLFSALCLGHYNPAASPTPPLTTLSLAVTQALIKMHEVVAYTYACLEENGKDRTDDEKDTDEPLRRTRRMKDRELRLIECQDILRDPLTGPLEDILVPWANFWSSG